MFGDLAHNGAIKPHVFLSLLTTAVDVAVDRPNRVGMNNT